MKEVGKITDLREKESINLKKVVFTKVSGGKTKRKVEVYTITLTEIPMKDNFREV
jgi:hypothetical protein